MENKPPGKMSEYTRPECEYLRQNCNFTPDEMEVFDLRCRDKSIVQISMELNLSDRTVKRRLQSIKRKIFRIL